MTEKICPECNGEGIVDQGTEDETRCPTCNGSGIVPDDGQDSEEVWNARIPSGATMIGGIEPRDVVVALPPARVSYCLALGGGYRGMHLIERGVPGRGMEV